MQRSRFLHCCRGSRCAALFLQHIHTDTFAEGFREKIFDAEFVTALRGALSNGTSDKESGVVKFFTAAMAQGALHVFGAIFIPNYLFTEGFRDKIFDMEIVIILRRALRHKDFNIRSCAVEILTDALAQGALCFCLWDIHTELFTEGFRDKIFDTEMVATLGHALGHEDVDIRTSGVEILTAALAQGVLHYFYGIFILKFELFAEGFRDKIFDMEIVVALGHTLCHKDFNIRCSVVRILTDALAQGALCWFYGIFIPKAICRGVSG